ncbi:MAG TPA: DUF503 domain-containing protein [Candidatus Marinimicrobia bacterium]|nr:DUF503 domain-containing protein [Candidatus Neomarinimicrobiota bacterium]HRS51554.1 DUF503 domain-containing protein [Candidatus Neomarinimicrobiota bacterium]HRU92932.1 DUF503 domain-containing protein [Candidatus Neomarinimicrobiota bacterium]
MTIGLLQIDLRLNNTHSLKDKRSIINHIKNQVKSKFNVSIAEIEPNDRYGRCLLGVTTISNNQEIVHQTLNSVEHLIENFAEIQIVGRKMEML